MKAARAAVITFCVLLAFGCATERKSSAPGKLEKAKQYHEQGVSLAREGRLEEALTAFKKAVKYYPEYGKAYYNMGLVYRELDQTEDAMEAYRKAIEIDPKDAAAHVNLGNLYLRQAQLSAAIVELETAVRIDPDYGLAHHNLALAYYLAHMYNRAWDHVKELERLGFSPDPDLKDAITAALNPGGEGGTKEK